MIVLPNTPFQTAEERIFLKFFPDTSFMVRAEVFVFGHCVCILEFKFVKIGKWSLMSSLIIPFCKSWSIIQTDTTPYSQPDYLTTRNSRLVEFWLTTCTLPKSQLATQKLLSWHFTDTHFADWILELLIKIAPGHCFGVTLANIKRFNQ